jgi:hypothetical protein
MVCKKVYSAKRFALFDGVYVWEIQSQDREYIFKGEVDPGGRGQDDHNLASSK